MAKRLQRIEVIRDEGVFEEDGEYVHYRDVEGVFNEMLGMVEKHSPIGTWQEDLRKIIKQAAGAIDLRPAIKKQVHKWVVKDTFGKNIIVHAHTWEMNGGRLTFCVGDRDIATFALWSSFRELLTDDIAVQFQCTPDNTDRYDDFPLSDGLLKGGELSIVGGTKLSAGAFDFIAYLRDLEQWSLVTFGPVERQLGIVDHIRKECVEIESEPMDLEEWVDLIMLGLDGAGRTGADWFSVADGLRLKLEKNKTRLWPDWRGAPRDKAIEHIPDDMVVVQQHPPDTCPHCVEGYTPTGRTCQKCKGTGQRQ